MFATVTANATNSCFKYLLSTDKSIYILTSTNENLILCSAKYIHNAMKLRSALHVHIHAYACGQNMYMSVLETFHSQIHCQYSC